MAITSLGFIARTREERGRCREARFSAMIAVVVAVSGVGICDAQTTSDQSASASAALDEITVTARKREESLVDVPASITLFSSEQLRNLGIESFIDYADKIPN